MDVSSRLVATFLFVTVLNYSCTSEIFFIKTNSRVHQCPEEPCLTLQELTSHHHRVESQCSSFYLEYTCYSLRPARIFL